VVAKVADHPDRRGALVYDLRVNPKDFTGLSPEKLAEAWSARGKEAPYFPVKALYYNRCPAIAPLIVLDAASAGRLSIDRQKLDGHLEALSKSEDFGDKLVRALEISKPKIQPDLLADPLKVDEQLYDGFISDADKTKAAVVRAAGAEQLADLNLDFADQRLNTLLPLYKARNYPKALTSDEMTAWEDFRRQKLLGGGDKSLLASFFAKLNELAARATTTDEQKYLLEELNLYAQSIAPVE
jgi:exodeoxyribonuclease-1